MTTGDEKGVERVGSGMSLILMPWGISCESSEQDIDSDLGQVSNTFSHKWELMGNSFWSLCMKNVTPKLQGFSKGSRKQVQRMEMAAMRLNIITKKFAYLTSTSKILYPVFISYFSRVKWLWHTSAKLIGQELCAI